MPQTIERHGARRRADDAGDDRRHGGPVVLATFASHPFEPRAARLAVEAAADMRATVFVIDVVDIKPGRRGAGSATDPVPDALEAALHEPAVLARELGVHVEYGRLPSLRPVASLLDLAEAHRPALLVFGPDPATLRRFRWRSRRRFRRFVWALEQHVPCLVWTAQEPAAAAASSRGRRTHRAAQPPSPSSHGPVVHPSKS